METCNEESGAYSPFWRNPLLSGCLWSLEAATVSAFRSRLQIPDCKIFNLNPCGVEMRVWAFDIINNNFEVSSVEYFFWLEDEQGDAVEGDSGQLTLMQKVVNPCSMFGQTCPLLN